MIPTIGKYHSHPGFPRAKVTHAASEEYKNAVNASGSRPTTLTVDKGILYLLW